MYQTDIPTNINLNRFQTDLNLYGRGDRIRTCDPLHPMQVLYQAELHPDDMCDDNIINTNKLQILFLGKDAYCPTRARYVLYLCPDNLTK